MQVAIRQDSADFADLLTFVGDFGIQDGSELIKPESSSPIDLADSAWLDDLDELFRETSPTQKNASIGTPLEGHTGVLTEEIPTKEEKALTVRAPATKSTKKTPSGRPPRVSRKEELEFLRLKVKEMQNQLQELQENSDCDRSPPIATSSADGLDNSNNSMQVEHSIALWKTMAGRQKNQRELVEVENVKLREKLKTQVRMAKSLKRILCKRDRDADQMSNTPKRSRPLLHGVNSTAALYDEMLQCLDELYVETDKRVANSPKASMAKPIIRKRDVKYTDAAGMFLEFEGSRLWPFDVHTVSRATWRFLTETGRKFNKYIEEHVEMRDNTMLRKFGVEINHGSSVAVMFGRQVIRRYVESNRVVLVRHSIIDEIQLPGAPTGGLTFRESGWIVLQNAPEEFSSGPATLTQAYSTLSPDIDVHARWEIGTLTNFVLQSREDVEAGNDAVIENLLLEEAAKQSTNS
ncbi:hypothetical protein PHYPSEUDO_010133 [Phytophthora pseudosyringae]|uniref:M96 mating-specific protein family n=1 Tax=Phytophthora pseudosyringae TaxID=221518 RepID=A0A8T1VBE9_9STRA|nr:hypothetical protein PHYPSEUDO_010133 [Phytophthora pseudosyringae]